MSDTNVMEVNTINNTQPINCNKYQNFVQSNIRDTQKKELLENLLKMNENLDADNDTKLAIDIAIGLFKLIVEEQQDLKNRQKIITECLKNYNDILKNYTNKSIKIDK